MRVAGICIDVPVKERPSARLLVLNDSTGSAVIEASESISSDHTDLAEQLHDMAEAVRSRLKGLGVDRVVVRRADRSPQASNAEGPRRRLLAEGAVISAARGIVVDTTVGTGKETGAWFGAKKADVDAAAKTLIDAGGLRGPFLEAAAAGLAGLAKP